MKKSIFSFSHLLQLHKKPKLFGFDCIQHFHTEQMVDIIGFASFPHGIIDVMHTFEPNKITGKLFSFTLPNAVLLGVKTPLP